MKKKLVALSTGLALLGMAGIAQATLTTIGTATYGGSDYNLIWDDNNNGNSVIWLDYSNARTDWAAQNSWAAGLDGSLTYNIDAAWDVSWDDADKDGTADAWRLGSAGENPNWGYNETTSEMGHLFYEELELDATLTFYAELNAGEFDNLNVYWYWSGTEYASNTDHAWGVDMDGGGQFNVDKNYYDGYGLAVRSGQVSAAAPVPEPATMLLFSTGLAGLAGCIRKRKVKSV